MHRALAAAATVAVGITECGDALLTAIAEVGMIVGEVAGLATADTFQLRARDPQAVVIGIGCRLSLLIVRAIQTDAIARHDPVLAAALSDI